MAVTLAYWCLLAAGLLPYIALLPAKKGVDNRNPRASYALQQGLQARAHAAHVNGLEAFPFFAAAVILGYLFEANRFWLDGLAAAFVVSRVLYTLAYWGDHAGWRSLIWFTGFAIVLALFSLPALSP